MSRSENFPLFYDAEFIAKEIVIHIFKRLIVFISFPHELLIDNGIECSNTYTFVNIYSSNGKALGKGMKIFNRKKKEL